MQQVVVQKILEPVFVDKSKKIIDAAQLIQNGKLVAFPTETVYGLGANALDDKAVAAIFEAKGRPSFNPLIIHVPDTEKAKQYVEFNARAELLANTFWPGALTLVLPRKTECGVSLLASAGLDTLAIRMPAHPLALEFLLEADMPIAAPSANRSGRISPTEAEHVREELGDKVAMILDGGACKVGLESTVIDLSGEYPVLLRPGSVTREALEEALGDLVLLPDSHAKQQPHSPGMLESHYAPNLSLRLNATNVSRTEALLAFGAPLMSAAMTLNLSESENLTEAAAHLFAYLRLADKAKFSGIAVMPIPERGLGMAINDRLRRAAAPRTTLPCK